MAELNPRLQRLALALAFFLRPAACSFSLDTVVQDYWYYVHNHLASTTSQDCLDAYAVPIDCDQTLLGIVSSNSPNFNPDGGDLARTCTTACADSLNDYVKNVAEKCTAEGDGALVETNTRPRPQVPVSVVGEIFQYEYAFACSKDGSSWCYLDYPGSKEWARSDFTCTNQCAAQFFYNAHTLPGANYVFGVYDLNDRSSWWENQWSDGWDHLQDCISSGDLASSATASWGSGMSATAGTEASGSTSESVTSTQSAGSTETATVTGSSMSSHATTGTGSQTATGTSSTLPTGTSTSGAGRVRLPFVGMFH
ncbi:1,4-beta-D-glucan cellobiohydrolase cel6a [Pestalotiopsis sp. 9143b]|nr:1,4-beta-D-glucan cellobiohydrolase cel6a [Pestalotiopsis sp. 9143b]